MDIDEKAQKLVDDAWGYSVDHFGRLFSRVKLGEKTPKRLNNLNLFEGKKTYPEYLEENLKQNQFPKLSVIDERLHIVAEAINFLPMSKKLSVDHHSTYIIEDNPDNDEDVEVLFSTAKRSTINLNKQRVKKFYDFIREKALELRAFDSRNRSEKSKAYNFNRFILMGKPGVGKTAFINYLFSVNAEDLLKKKIIYIRVHVSSHSKERYLNLQDKLHNKFLKIFCQFYLHDKSHQFMDAFILSFKENLISKVESQKKFSFMRSDERKKLVDNFIYMLNAVHDETTTKPGVRIEYQRYGLNLEQARELNELLMEFVQIEYSMSYVFIFDGLDNVTIDYAQYEEFKDWIEQIDTVTDNKTTNYKAVYLITMRDYSFVSFFFYHVRGNDSLASDYVHCIIEPKPLDLILEKKYDLAVKWLDEAGQKYTQDQIKNINKNLIILLYTELHKVSNLPYPSSSDKITFDTYFQHFMKLNNDNLRATMRFFRELIVMATIVLKKQAFTELIKSPTETKLFKKFQGKDWIIYRVLLYGGCSHGAYRNRVKYNREGCVEINSNNRAIIPNIFNYRDYITERDSDIWFPKNLIKIRIIQYLRKSPKHTGILSVLRWLKTTFKYQHNDLRFEIREMIYNGLLSPIAKEIDVIRAEKEKTDYDVELTCLSHSIMDNLLKKSVYFETIIDDTPIQSDYICKMEPMSRYDKTLSLKNYLIGKSKSVTFFVLYLQEIECKDKINFIDSGEWDETDYKTSGYEIFTTEMLQDLKQTIVDYVRGFLKDEKKYKGQNAVDDFVESWSKTFEMLNAEKTL